MLIFNARVHIGHTDASITVSTLPSAKMVSCSLDAPLIEVKLPKKVAPAAALIAMALRYAVVRSPSAEENEPHGHLQRKSRPYPACRIASKAWRWFR